MIIKHEINDKEFEDLLWFVSLWVGFVALLCFISAGVLFL